MILEGYLAMRDYQIFKLADISGLKNLETVVFLKIIDENKKLYKRWQEYGKGRQLLL